MAVALEAATRKGGVHHPGSTPDEYGWTNATWIAGSAAHGAGGRGVPWGEELGGRDIAVRPGGAARAAEGCP